MARLLRMFPTLAAGFLFIAAACGSDSPVETGSGVDAGPPVDSAEPAETTLSDSAEIMADAAHQLVTVDHTFGDGPSPFSTFLIQTTTDPNAGSGTTTDTYDSRPLTEAERSAIESRIGPLGEVVWIDDPEAYRTTNYEAAVEGSAILGLGEPTIESDTALAPVSMWCGGTCGTWFTYALTFDAATGWAISGIDGPVAIS